MGFVIGDIAYDAEDIAIGIIVEIRADKNGNEVPVIEPFKQRYDEDYFYEYIVFEESEG